MDWTDVETFSRPPSRGTRDCAGPGASWGHRSGGGPGQDSELFSGYYAPAGTMMRDEHGPPVPELARRMTVCSCHHDPARALVPVLTAMPQAGIPPGDILAGSGYAHRDAGAWAVPLRLAGAQLVQDLHPLDRGPRGTHHGAIIANGNLYCPATPRALPEPGPLTRDATPGQASAHDQQPAELARHKLGLVTSDDADGRASNFPDCGSFRIVAGKDRNYGGEIPEVLTRVPGRSSPDGSRNLSRYSGCRAGAGDQRDVARQLGPGLPRTACRT